MNQRGFATSILIYTILGIFLVVTATMMVSVRNSRSLNNSIKEDILSEKIEITANKIVYPPNDLLTEEICAEYDSTYDYAPVNVQCALDYLYDRIENSDE